MKRFIITEEEKKHIMNLYGKQLNEETLGPEPIISYGESIEGGFLFAEGAPNSFNPNPTDNWLLKIGRRFQVLIPSAEPFGSSKIFNRKEFINKIKNNISPSTLTTLQNFYKNPNVKIPKNFISFKVGTSSTQSNSKVAEARLTFLKDIIRSTFQELNLLSDTINEIIMNMTHTTYTRSEIDRNFYDTSKMEPKFYERVCGFEIMPLATKGLGVDQTSTLTGGLSGAKKTLWTDFESIFSSPSNEFDILRYLKQAQTFSDLKDISIQLKNNMGVSLADFLNENLSIDSLNNAFKIIKNLAQISRVDSGKVQMVNGKIGINFEGVYSQFEKKYIS